MGTNYNARINVCSHCERPDVVLHICKNMSTFQAFRRFELLNVTHADSASAAGDLLAAVVADAGGGTGGVDIDSWEKWKAVLRSDKFVVRVCDEDGVELETEAFIADVEAVDPQRRRRGYDWVMTHDFLDIPTITASIRADYHLDADDFTFCSREFS